MNESTSAPTTTGSAPSVGGHAQFHPSRRAAAAVVAIAVILSGCGSSPRASSPHPLGPISARLVFATSSPRSGSSFGAVLLVDNRTGHRLHAAPCTRNWIVLGLVSAQVPDRLPIPPPDCAFHLSLPEGRSAIHVNIPTVYGDCGLARLREPACVEVGPLYLPTGTYRLELAFTGLRPVPGLGALPTITVREPQWRAELRPGEGSLAVAASPCVAIAMPSVEDYFVSITVRQGRHVVEYTAGHGGLSVDYALPAGTYFVHTSVAFRYGYVHVRAGRLTLDNLNADCI